MSYQRSKRYKRMENKMPNKDKFINEYGEIKEGQLLTPEEVKIFEDPLFETVPFNTAVRGAYYSATSINNTLAYILTHFKMTRRGEAAPRLDQQRGQSASSASSGSASGNKGSISDTNISDNTNVCAQCGEVLDADGMHTVDADNPIRTENTNA
jgi:hypothetical protein